MQAWFSRNRRLVMGIVITAVCLLGLLALHRLASEVTYHQLRAAFRGIPSDRLWLSVALTVASYLALSGYDYIALQAVGHPLPWRTAALASFTSYTLSHNLGLSLLTGGSARVRIYRSEGVEPGLIGGVIAVASINFWCGVALLAGCGLVLGDDIPGLPAGLAAMALPAGAALIVVGLLPLAARIVGVERVRIGSWQLPAPTQSQWLRLISAAVADLAAASAALFVLIPDLPSSTYPLLFTAYALAMIVALVSHVPGGVGVFEAVIMAAVPGDKSQLLAALLAYRAIYYILPLFAAALLLLLHEKRVLRGGVAGSVINAGRLGIRALAPLILGSLTFVGGLMLLLSGATPAMRHRAAALAQIVPMPFSEASHVAASVIGTVLLLVSQGLWRRLDGAFVLARSLLLAGAVFSILKGFDYEEATLCLVIAGLLQLSRSSFYRKTALTTEPLSPQWTIAAVAGFLGSAAVGLFAYKHVEYSDALWWRFVTHDGAPRFLRATLAGGALLAGFGVMRMFRPARRDAPGEPLDEARFTRALADTHHCDAFLALNGDKRFLYAPEGDAFLMFGVRGGTWIVLGDPVGPEARWSRLLWRLREKCDAAQATVLFYQLGERSLPYVIDMGFRVSKYGEEAIVPLPHFSLDGKAFKSLRYSVRRAAAEGAEFAVLSPAETRAAMTELGAVSDEWLDDKQQSEKGFSLGRFDPDYLARFPCAVIRQNGRIVAFANVLALPNRNELSVDLMRHRSDLPYGTMDLLFVELMRWGAAQGYRSFNLGLTPLAGLPRHRLAPLLGQAGSLLFRRGERFYGFAGLRGYKAKFQPVWRSSYLAAPSEMAMLRSLTSLYGLISRRKTPATPPARAPKSPASQPRCLVPSCDG
ncbi:MAG: bifunctional lysylphosphatidylglycerol flippase/synthetase MprF, partial [Proteobacteria bacterium]|nr:bifunctional lysylphosphatidylglycerol flippase/synthetase MprF [Pseudomonadota bacterium]